VIATCRIGLFHTNGTATNGVFGVSEISSSLPGSQDLDCQIPANAPSGTYYIPFGTNAIFDVTAGSNIFYFLGDENSGSIDVADVQLSLIFIPTSYGTITPPVAGTEISDDSQVSSPLTPAEVAQRKAQSERDNDVRIQAELDEMKRKIEELQREIEID
jgi:hypothetical protein